MITFHLIGKMKFSLSFHGPLADSAVVVVVVVVAAAVACFALKE